MNTWDSGTEPDYPAMTVLGGLRVVLRALLLAVVVFGGLLLLLLLRLIERPLFRLHRPMTPYITQMVCRAALTIIGIHYQVEGMPMQRRGVVVSNHSSWLDIFALNAAKRVYFVSKSEVAGWMGIGWLARATGTVFIERNPRRAQEQTLIFHQRLHEGHKLLFFPEGTSTDGLQVLPFKTTLFASFLKDDIRHEIAVQPVTLIYTAPAGTDPRFYGWWGDMSFGAHLLRTLAPARHGSVRVVFHTPLPVTEYADRKALARASEDAVRSAMPQDKVLESEYEVAR